MLGATVAHAQTVTDEQVKYQVEVIFHVQEGSNSPYQGRLLYQVDPGQAQRTADELAQYQQWKDNLAAAQAQAAAHANDVPAAITSASARRLIVAMGLKDRVEAIVAQADQATQDLWYTADKIDRNNPQLLALAPLIPLSSDQLDEMFRQGDPAP